jgi:hypothetical protein
LLADYYRASFYDFYFAASKGVSAHTSAQTLITSPSQLIDAVNNLRLSYRLLPLTVHSVLMQSSQSQADIITSDIEV